MNDVETNGYLVHEAVHPIQWDAFGGFEAAVAEIAVSVLQGILICVPPECQSSCVSEEKNTLLVTCCGECTVRRSYEIEWEGEGEPP